MAGSQLHKARAHQHHRAVSYAHRVSLTDALPPLQRFQTKLQGAAAQSVSAHAYPTVMDFSYTPLIEPQEALSSFLIEPISKTRAGNTEQVVFSIERKSSSGVRNTVRGTAMFEGMTMIGSIGLSSFGLASMILAGMIRSIREAEKETKPLSQLSGSGYPRMPFPHLDVQ